MSFLKRAYLQTVRKKSNTVIMFFILLIVSTLILTCISIQTATNTTALNIRKSFAGSFTINAKNTEGQLMDSVIEDILSIDGIVSQYNLRCYYYAEYKNLEGEILNVTSEGAAEIIEGYENAGKVVSNSYSDIDTYFTEAGFEIISGRHIGPEDKAVILVSQNFALQNELQVGDVILMEGIEGVNSQQVEIIGIFEPAIPLETGIAPSYDLYDNVTFTDNGTYSLLYFEDGIHHYQYGDFYLDDPEEMEEIVQTVVDLDKMAWDECIISKNDADYQKAKSDLGALQNLVKIIIVVVIVMSVLLLTLVLMLWIKNRIHETGVLLSMGIGKINILLQHTAEVLMIAVFSFALSYATSSFIAQNVCDNLLVRTTGENQILIENLTEQTLTEEASDMLDNLIDVEIVISFRDLLIIYIIGTGIILLSVLSASYSIMRMKPEEVLSKMS